MRNKIIGLGCALVGMAAAVMPASAKLIVVDLGVLGDGTFLPAAIAGSIAKNTTFADYAEFTLTESELLLGVGTSISKGFVSGTLALYENAVFHGAMAPSGILYPGASAVIDSSGSANLTNILLSPGKYYVEESGKSGGAGVNFSGSISLSSAVPEPTTWALMLVGFAGMGFYGSRKLRAQSGIVAA
jgi:hypothetical protein